MHGKGDMVCMQGAAAPLAEHMFPEAANKTRRRKRKEPEVVDEASERVYRRMVRLGHAHALL